MRLQRSAMRELAPRTVQNMPDILSLRPMTVLQPGLDNTGAHEEFLGAIPGVAHTFRITLKDHRQRSPLYGERALQGVAELACQAELPGAVLSEFEHRFDRPNRSSRAGVGPTTSGIPRALSHRAGIPGAHRRSAAP